MRTPSVLRKSLEERKLEIPTTTTNIPLHLYVYTPVACLQSSRSPYLDRDQRTSRAPNLCASSTSLHAQHTSRAPDLDNLYVSTSTRVQHTSRAPDLHTCTSPRLHASSAPPELLRQTPTRPYTRCTPPDLHTSYRQHACIAPRKLRSSIPLHPHAPAPAACLQSPKAPCLF